MALWGTKDTVYSTGNITTIAITNGDGVITGDGTTWDEALHVGKVINEFISCVYSIRFR